MLYSLYISMRDLEKFLKYFIVVGIFAVVIFTPFVFSNSLFFPYVAGKALFLRVVVTVLVGAWIILFSLNKRYLPNFNWITVTFLSLLVWIAIANIFGDSLTHSFWSNFERMEGYINLVHVFAFFLLSATVLDSKKMWLNLFKASIAAAVFMAFIAIGENMDGVNRADALLGNPIYLAGYMLIHAFFALFFMLSNLRESAYFSFFYGSIVLFFITTVLITGTRGAMLGLVVGAFFAAVAVALRKGESVWVKRVACGVFGVALVIGSLLSLVVFVNNYEPIKDTEWAVSLRESVSEIPAMRRFSKINFAEGGAKARFLLWGIAVDGIKDEPLLGRGQGNYINLFNYKYNPELFERERWFDRSHNIFLEWGVAGGVPGMLLYVAMFFVATTLLWRSREVEYYIKVVFTALLLAYAVQNFFVFDNITSYVFFASMFAFITAITTDHEKLRSREPIFSFKHIKFIVIPLVLVSFSIFIYNVHIKALEANKMIIQGMLGIECGVHLEKLEWGGLTSAFAGQLRGSRCEQFLPSDIFFSSNRGVEYSAEEISDHIFLESLERFKRAIELTPIARQEAVEMIAVESSKVFESKSSNDTKADFLKVAEEEFIDISDDFSRNTRAMTFLGHLYLTTGMYEKAVDLFEATLLTAPNRQHMLFSLAQSYKGLGNYEKANGAYRRAYELAPWFKEPAFRYAVSLLSIGDEDGYEDILKDFPERDIVFDRTFIASLIEVKQYERLIDIHERRIEILWDNLSGKELSDDEIRKLGQEYIDIIRYYKEIGENEEAKKVAEEGSEKLPRAKDVINGFISDLEI